MASDKNLRTVLTVAGSDSSGGAGLQMDLKAFAALGVHGCAVVTAVTAQNTSEVRHVSPVPAKLVREQLDALFDDFKIDVVKTGMLFDSSIVEAVAAKLAEEGTKLVVDPVLVSSAGPALSSKDLVQALRDRLIPKAYLCTPNIPEAAELTDNPIRGEDGMRRACQDLYQLGCENILVKGGHLAKGPIRDVFYDGSFRVFEGTRIERKVHGTGCMLSAFITAILAKGIPCADAVELARRYTFDAIRFSSDLGRGASIANPLTTLHNSAQRYHCMEEILKWTGALEEFLPVSLVPEVGINLAFALPYATTLDEVCAVEGRLVKTGQKVRRVGHPQFGASKQVGSVVLAAMEHDRRYRCAINLRYSKPLVDLCRTLGMKVGSFDRRKEPRDATTLHWGTDHAIQALGFVPDIIFDEGDHAKEPMIRILGEHPAQVIDKVRSIVKELKDAR